MGPAAVDDVDARAVRVEGDTGGFEFRASSPEILLLGLNPFEVGVGMGDEALLLHVGQHAGLVGEKDELSAASPPARTAAQESPFTFSISPFSPMPVGATTGM